MCDYRANSSGGEPTLQLKLPKVQIAQAVTVPWSEELQTGDVIGIEVDGFGWHLSGLANDAS